MREKNDPLVQAFGQKEVNEWDLGWEKINRDFEVGVQEIQIYSHRIIDYTFSEPGEKLYRKWKCLIYGHDIVNTNTELNSYCKCCLKLFHQIKKSEN